MDEDSYDCPLCGGPVNILGQLGRLIHVRCRHCGAPLTIDTVDPVDAGAV